MCVRSDLVRGDHVAERGRVVDHVVPGGFELALARRRLDGQVRGQPRRVFERSAPAARLRPRTAQETWARRRSRRRRRSRLSSVEHADIAAPSRAIAVDHRAGAHVRPDALHQPRARSSRCPPATSAGLSRRARARRSSGCRPRRKCRRPARRNRRGRHSSRTSADTANRSLLRRSHARIEIRSRSSRRRARGRAPSGCVNRPDRAKLRDPLLKPLKLFAVGAAAPRSPARCPPASGHAETAAPAGEAEIAARSNSPSLRTPSSSNSSRTSVALAVRNGHVVRGPEDNAVISFSPRARVAAGLASPVSSRTKSWKPRLLEPPRRGKPAMPPPTITNGTR